MISLLSTATCQLHLTPKWRENPEESHRLPLRAALSLVHSMYTTCTLHVHYMYTTCTLHVHYRYTTYSIHVHSIYTTTALQVHYKYTPCTLHVHYRYTACSVHVVYMYTTCSVLTCSVPVRGRPAAAARATLFRSISVSPLFRSNAPLPQLEHDS